MSSMIQGPKNPTLLVDPPLVTPGRVGLLLLLPCTAPHRTAPHRAPLKVSTELTRLYTGLYSAVLVFGGSTLEASGYFFIYSDRVQGSPQNLQKKNSNFKPKQDQRYQWLTHKTHERKG